MDEGASPAIIINFILKGGPPWGFRIKQRANRVIISKVNCGGRAHKCGLKTNDEIVAVNNLEVDKHPLTLDRSVEGNGEVPEEIQQLTKLDFTYQLIKHTINRQLHLTVRRHSDTDISYQPCCYFIEDDVGANEAYPLAELYSQSEEEILSPTEDLDQQEIRTFVKSNPSSHVELQLLQHQQLHQQQQQQQQQLHPQQHHHHHHHILSQQQLHHHIHGHQGACAAATGLVPGARSLSLFNLPPGGDLTPSDLPDDQITVTRTNSEESIMPGAGHPTYKAKAPKNIWSPGSTTNSSSESLSKPKRKTQTVTTSASATQTTPTKTETLPRGFRPVRLNSLPLSSVTTSSAVQQSLPLGASASNLDPCPLSPSTISEVSIATSGAAGGRRPSAGGLSGADRTGSPPPSPLHKYWTLPRHISIGSKADRDSEKDFPRQTRIKQIESNEPPPPNARFLYETSSAKYFTVPVSTIERTTSTFSVPEPKKYEGIGPLNESGVPVSLRTGVKEEYGSDWYKTMYKRLHKLENPNRHQEPLKIKIRHEHRGLDTNYFSDDEGSARRAAAAMPKNIANYEPGRSSINVREKQMFYADLINYIDTIFSDVFTLSTMQQDATGNEAKAGTSNDANLFGDGEDRERARRDQQARLAREAQHQRNCVFSALTASATNGYESDSSYIIKKREAARRGSKEVPPEPATRSTYVAVQRGDTDIPMSGLQKPAPHPSAHKVGPVPQMTLWPEGWILSSDNEEPSSAYEAPSPEPPLGPPARPPTPRTDPRDKSIDDWHQKINEDFDFIYQNLEESTTELNQEKELSQNRQQRQEQFKELPKPEPPTKTENTLGPENAGREVVWPPPSEEHESTPADTGSALKKNKKSSENSHQHHHRSKHASSSSSSSSKRHTEKKVTKEVSFAGQAISPPPRSAQHLPKAPPVPPTLSQTDDVYYSKRASTDIDLFIRQIEQEQENLSNFFAEPEFDDGRDSPHQFAEREVNIHYRAPVTRLMKDDLLNEEDLVKKQREHMHRYYQSEFERRAARDSQLSAQRKHHFNPSQGPVVHLERYQKAYAEKAGDSPITKLQLAKVLFDFHALSAREISVKKGDVVIIQRTVNHNWVEVEDSESGLKGLVPRNYLDYEQDGIARAKFDFEAKTPVELQLKKGETLRLVRKVDDNWYEGINSKDEMGIFPCCYVDTVRPPLALQLNNNSTHSPLSASPSRPHSRGRSVSPQLYSRSLSPVRPHSTPHFNGRDGQQQQQPPGFGQRGGGHQLMEDTVHRHHEPQAPPTGSYGHRGGPLGVTGGRAPPGGNKLYRVLFPYKPLQQDELELIAGDVLTVSMHCDDGWFVGQSNLTGHCGTFPGNYVDPLV